MKKALSLLCLALLLLTPASGMTAGKGIEYDMNKITCKEIFADAESITFALFWIDGYLSRKKDNMMLSEESIKEIGKELTEECKGEPNKKLGAILKDW